MSFAKVVAIDGPSGSGKSTIAKQVASVLRILYVDTGAMFRALGCSCDTAGISFEESEQLNTFLKDIDFQYGVSEGQLVVVNGTDLTKTIREHRASDLASRISQLPSVRTFLLEFQQKLAAEKICIMEGRDIGTVVFPTSFCKVFLTADPEVRARRRYDELAQKGNNEVTFEQVLADVKERDERDMNREVAPLRQADDATLVDTSGMTPQQVVQKITEVASQKALEVGLDL